MCARVGGGTPNRLTHLFFDSTRRLMRSSGALCRAHVRRHLVRSDCPEAGARGNGGLGSLRMRQLRPETPVGNLVARCRGSMGPCASVLTTGRRSPVLATHKTCRGQEGMVSEEPVGVRHICTHGITQKAPARPPQAIPRAQGCPGGQPARCCQRTHPPCTGDSPRPLGCPLTDHRTRLGNQAPECLKVPACLLDAGGSRKGPLVGLAAQSARRSHGEVQWTSQSGPRGATWPKALCRLKGAQPFTHDRPKGPERRPKGHDLSDSQLPLYRSTGNHNSKRPFTHLLTVYRVRALNVSKPSFYSACKIRYTVKRTKAGSPTLDSELAKACGSSD